MNGAASAAPFVFARADPAPLRPPSRERRGAGVFGRVRRVRRAKLRHAGVFRRDGRASQARRSRPPARGRSV